MFQMLAIVSALLTLPTDNAVLADEPTDADQLAAAEQLLTVLESVLDNHVAPPTRQEMLLRGCRAIVAQDDLELQGTLGRQISDLQGTAEMAQFLAKLLPEADHSTFARIEQNFINGALTAVPGGARYSQAKDYAVEQQLRENRYVGIGIALSMQNDHPTMMKVIPGGPAHRAGGKDGDLMISIGDRDATKLKLQEVVEILRGQEGKPVSIVVRQPDSDKERTLDIVRGQVPFGSVEGVRRNADDEWVHRVREESDIAYLRLTAIRGSSARELKQVAKALHAEGFRALILDLRPTSTQGDLRHAVMIADELLGEATIGTALTGGTQQEFDSSPDQLFAGWPVAVLVGPNTRGQAEWIAAALQDHERATILGQETPGAGHVQRSIELPNGDAITFRSGILRRADQRTLVSEARSFQVVGLSQNLRRATGDFTKPRTAKGWHGVKPDEVVDGQQVLPRAIEVLEEQLETADDSSAAE
jgi:C-terminal peptidase prc